MLASGGFPLWLKFCILISTWNCLSWSLSMLSFILFNYIYLEFATVPKLPVNYYFLDRCKNHENWDISSSPIIHSAYARSCYLELLGSISCNSTTFSADFHSTLSLSLSMLSFILFIDFISSICFALLHKKKSCLPVNCYSLSQVSPLHSLYSFLF